MKRDRRWFEENFFFFKCASQYGVCQQLNLQEAILSQ